MVKGGAHLCQCDPFAYMATQKLAYSRVIYFTRQCQCIMIVAIRTASVASTMLDPFMLVQSGDIAWHIAVHEL